jgi:hypothetical protein
MIEGLTQLEMDDSTTKLTVGLADQLVAHRTWMGQIEAEELGMLLASARQFTFETFYTDASTVRVVCDPGTYGRQIRFTSGRAPDAVHACLHRMRRIGPVRRIAIAAPVVSAVASSISTMAFAVAATEGNLKLALVGMAVSSAATALSLRWYQSGGSVLPARGRAGYRDRAVAEGQLPARRLRRLVEFPAVNGTNLIVSVGLSFVAIALTQLLRGT